MARTLFSLSQELGQLLLSHRLKLALAESCTGGALAKEITLVPGSSQWFDRAFITYSNDAKIEQLGMKPESLQTEGAVSELTAREMVEGVIRHSHADIALSITGIAGPTGATSTKSVGDVCFGLMYLNQTSTRTIKFNGGRDHVRQESVRYALMWLLEILQHGMPS